jgi:hypothetical protein
MQERDLKIVENFKSLVSQRVKVHEVRFLGQEPEEMPLRSPTLMYLL